jgi:hypothetical protein
MLIRDPVVQKLNGRPIGARGVAAIPVAEHLDVVEQVGNRFGTGRVARTIRPFGLKADDEALREHVVPATALAARRADRAVLAELDLENVVRVLTAPVRVMSQSRQQFSPEPRHRGRIHHAARRLPRLDRPTTTSRLNRLSTMATIKSGTSLYR